MRTRGKIKRANETSINIPRGILRKELPEEEKARSSDSSSESFEESSVEEDIEEIVKIEDADFLVVDDNMHNLFTLKAILKNMFKKAKIDLAYNGKEALTKVE